MRRINIIFSIVLTFILLIAISNKTNAMTVSASSSQSTVSSGNEFSIIIKFDEKVKALNAHISYNPDLVTISDKTSNPYLAINPEYAKGDLALVYSPIQIGVSEDTFELTVKAKDVTAEQLAKFTVSNIEVTTEETTAGGETLPNKDITVTIKPKEEQPQQNKVDNGIKNNVIGNNVVKNNAIVNNANQYNKGSLAKTGESQIILLVVAVLLISIVILRIKYKSIK